MIRRVLLIIGMGFWLYGGYDIVAQSAVVLTGKTTKVKIVEDKSSVVVTVELDLTLRNQSEANAILYLHDFQLVGNAVYRLGQNESRELLYEISTLPSTSRSPEWTDLQNRLNAESPPSGLTWILRRGESISMKRITGMTLYGKGRDRASWDEIRAASPVWLSVTLDMFPSNLDKTSISQKSFGEKLQKRWKSIGMLQLGVIQSEPIRLDLSNQ